MVCLSSVSLSIEDDKLIASGASGLTADSAVYRKPVSGEQPNWQVIAGGESHGSSVNFTLSGTVGQGAVGIGTSTNYGLNQGFWQEFCKCGDADNSGTWTISDAVFLIKYIFTSGPAPVHLSYGDADGSESITISDAVYLINFIFNQGPEPQC